MCEEWRWLSHARDIEDCYILGDIIARGEFAVVHKCLYKGKSERACKIYRKADLDRDAVKSQATVLPSLQHPNLIRLVDIFETSDEIRMVNELASGEELLERIAESGTHTEIGAAKPAAQAISALKYLHSKGIVHGSVRPENLLYETINPSAPLRLVGVPFKKSRHSPRLCYSAPELFKLKEPSPASDMWSLGVVLYILLSGSEPIFEETDQNQEGENRDATLFPDHLWEEVSPSARDLVSKCMRIQPEARISAEEAEDHPWVCGKTAASCPMPSAQDRLRQFNARRKFKAATQAIVATQKAMNLISPERKTATSR